jgi:2-polyprenyl-3-methyl-5-hydroxy-6-metoxy-1,4-benzoquinol methylase
MLPPSLREMIDCTQTRSASEFTHRIPRWRAALASRIRAAEVMDQPELDPEEHRRALIGLARLNRVSGSVGVVWPAVAAAARAAKRPLRVLDLATGSGDVPLGLWRRASRRGHIEEIVAVDISAQAVETANRSAAHRAAVRFMTLDVLNDPLPKGFDVVMTSLFLHHLERCQAVALLANMAAAARQLVLVNDLVRSRGNLFLVALAARLLTTSRVVRTDASLSVRAAFTVPELRTLAQEAGLLGGTISRRFPCRMLLEWRK